MEGGLGDRRPCGGLVYVIGASGAGKDTLIAWVRARLSATRPDLPVAFAHRYITRGADAVGENHVSLRPAEFQTRLDAGLFALAWDSHGLRYGVGVEIDLWRAAGLTVVVNGSRAHLPCASGRYPDIRPVMISVAPDILRRRLEARGRETAAEIAARLERTAALRVDHPGLARVDNSGSIEAGGARLLALIEAVADSSRRLSVGEA
ncbi:phosphonate metabolism protein/1,5-bisphosphokinase (PRPP-forming) PhnN [Roseospira goensis]|uniref:Ribose 1,5-bisphosphate phosphokinase PhnN n=1 Tax=Roseospira goensis TaxID=391922 RepID=A0A7W6S0E7_9PROT|nr:phosphonate metabolism protein/1,5-bisphosphokinase (PRPP-forming) PhnN [Roseospira goensis]MBB4286090.1 ribose 1,5-bisphosphokinase [Roseospira goensis]